MSDAASVDFQQNDCPKGIKEIDSTFRPLSLEGVIRMIRDEYIQSQCQVDTYYVVQ